MHTGHCIINDRRCPLPRRGRKPTDPQPKFFNPRRRHRDLALIPRPCVCNLTFGKEKRKEIVVASIYIELLLRKELLILYLEIEPILRTNFSTLDIVIVILLLWRILRLYMQFSLEKKEIAIIVFVLCKLLHERKYRIINFVSWNRADSRPNFSTLDVVIVTLL